MLSRGGRNRSAARRLKAKRYSRGICELLEARILLTVNAWANSSGGDWDTPSNWSLGHVPTEMEDVQITLPGTYTVTHSLSNNDSCNSLISSVPFTFSAGVLNVATTMQISGTFTLNGGTLGSATISQTGGATLSLTSGTLSDVTVAAGTTVSDTGFSVSVTNGLTLDGTLDVGAATGSSFSQLFFVGTQTLAGNGTVVLGGSVGNAIYSQDGATPGVTLTIGSGVVIDGGSGSITGYDTGDSIINKGTIDGDEPGTIGLSGDYRGGGSVFSNAGIVEETSDGNMDIGASASETFLTSAWNNSGTFSVAGGGSLNLYGSFATSTLGAIENSGGNVNLIGTLNNAGGTLALNSTTGPWNLDAGTIDGGTITDTASDLLSLTGAGGGSGTLSDVTLTSGSVLDGTKGPGQEQTDITGGLTLNGTLELGTASGSTAMGLVFYGTQTLSGSGTVIFGGSEGNEIRSQSADGVTPAILTLGSGITIQAGAGEIISEYSFDSFINQATINLTTDATFTLSANNWINQGKVSSQSGNTLIINGSGWTNSGTFAVSGTGILNLEGSYTTAAIGNVSRSGGTINLAGTLNNTGTTLALTPTTGNWNLAGGTIDGGTITDTAGALLVLAGSVIVEGQSTLSGVTIPAGSTLDGTEGPGQEQTDVTGGLTLNGTLELGTISGSTAMDVAFYGTQTLSGSGTVIFGGSEGNEIRAQSANGSTPAILTLGSGITIDGGAGEITAEDPTDSFINQATINLTTGATFTFVANNWINEGTITYNLIGDLILNGTDWSNQGTLTALNGCFLLLEGTDYTLPGTIDAPTADVFILGTLNNAGAMLALTTSDPGWYIGNGDFSGAISGGTITTASGVHLGVAQGGGTISGVTLAGVLTIEPVFESEIKPLIVTGGLTLEGGTLNILGGVLPGSDVDFEGTQTLGGTGTVNLSGVSAGFGMLIPNAGDVLTISPGVTIEGNSGQVGSSGGGTFTNQGTIEADGGGTLIVEGDTNFAGSTLTGGTWQAVASSTLDLIGANIVTNAAGLLLNGATSHIYSNTGTTNALAGITSNTSAGALTIQAGANLTTPSSFNNQGLVDVGSGSTLTVSGSFTDGGSTQVDGTLSASGPVTISAGASFIGSGTVAANVVNNGQLTPGDGATMAGALAINGSYTQASSGALTIDVGGVTAGNGYAQLNISGSATLSGTLNATLFNGFAPALEETFDVLNFANSTGSFVEFNSALISGAPAFVTNSTSTSVSLVGATISPDLAVSAVTFTPAGGSIGQDITVNYTVENLGTVGTTTGTWTDSVYISSSAALMADSTLLGRVTHTGNVVGLSSYMGTLTAPLPGLTQGNYYVVVVADSAMQVPDVNRANNVGAASMPLSVAPPLISVGTAVSGTITNRQQIYYELNVAPGSNVQLEATFAVADESEFLVRYGSLPTTSSFDESNTTELSELQPQLVLPSGQGGDYFILLDGRESAGTGESFKLLASVVPFEVSSFSTASGNNTGPVSMTITGSGFTEETAVSLIDGGTTIAAQSTTFINANQLMVTFDLNSQPAGNYSVKAVDGGQSSVAPGTFKVTAEAPNSDLNVFAVTGSGGLVGMPAFLAAGVTNIGNTDVQLPTYELIGTNVNGVSMETIQFGGGTLAPGESTGPEEPNYYGPGLSGRVEFLPYPDQPGTTTTWSIQAVPPTTDVDWTSLASSPPFDIPAAAWKAIVANLAANIGNTVTDLENAFQADAIYLAQIGESVADQTTLLAFEVQKATDTMPAATLSSATDSTTVEPGLPLTFSRSFSQSQVSRYSLSSLGYGWTSNWDISATTDPSTGNVYVQEGTVTREFQKLSNGTYAGADGDQGVLTLSGGSYTLTEVDGTITSFLPDGQLNYIQDSLGDRITAAYDDGLMTSLTANNGDQMTFTYNRQNLISTVTDPAGQVTTYTYDANSELTGVSNNLGNYQYSYVSSPSIETAHDLASVTYPGGTHSYFSYDSQGRLIEQSADDGANAFTYAYLPVGGYTSTDAAGETTTVLYDVNGQQAVVKDALGNVTETTYNASGQAVEVSLPGGSASSTTYGADGQASTTVDPLGNSTQYTYNQSGDIVSLENANGNTTSFAYNAQAELTAITQPDGSATSDVYNAQGEAVESMDALGRVTHYTYDSHGRLVLRVNPDGSYVAYGYDSSGDLISVADASGTITMTYDSAHDLTGVTYPNGQYLHYTYAAGGQVTQVVDQTGFTENYLYNTEGQLIEVTDATGEVVASYAYNLAGELTAQVNGNGTYTTYAYDANGNLLHLINFAPDSSINSRFDYKYNALNETTSESTLAGTTTYGYDADGQLTRIVLPSGETITYAYDAVGNRTVVSDTGGTTTDYTTNNENEYTSVGGFTYSYDADGNLVVSGGAGGDTTYTYDDEGRLIQEQTPTDTYTYQYDALGNLVASTDNGQTTQYFVDPLSGNVVAEYNGSGNLIAHFAYGLGLVSQVTATGVHEYYDYDAAGSTAGVSGPSGTYLDSYTYLPFGTIQSASGTAANPFQFEGQFGVISAGAGIDYMRARFYSPSLGRFLNRDPIGLAGGINAYTYTSNNPVSLADPSGEIYVFTNTNLRNAYRALGLVVDALYGPLPPFPATDPYEEAIDQTQGITGDLLNTVGPGGDPGSSFVNGSGVSIVQNSAGYLTVAVEAAEPASQALSEAEADAAEYEGYVAGVLASALALVEALGLSGSSAALLTGIGAFAAEAVIDLIPPVAVIAAFSALIYEINQAYNESVLAFLFGYETVVSGATLASTTYTIVGPHDPNYVLGPGGVGSQGFVQSGTALPYTVGFENEATATAPAHVVEVSEQIDPNLDWSTFQLGDFGFGGQLFTVPTGLTTYSTQINEVSTLGVYVDVDADFDELTGQLIWTFTTIDPTTLDDPVGNPFEGFLPPNVTPPEGEGFISYAIQPKVTDPTGTLISAQATVIFDAGLSDQSPLATPSISNTIDSSPPTSSIGPLPPQEPTSFPLNWSGTDAGGSGIANYSIYVSDDGGPYTGLLLNTTDTSTTFTGQIGQTYSFYSVATDNVGNIQPTPTAAQATTLVTYVTNQWAKAVSGDWDNPANWSLGHVPTAVENAVINLPGIYTVTHDQSVSDTVNSLVSTEEINLLAGSIQINAGEQISNVFLLDGSLSVAGTGTLGPITGDGNLTLGIGSSAANVQLTPNTGISSVSSLTLVAGSTLDITNNGLTIDYGSGVSPISTIQAGIASGYDQGKWKGTGIISSTAASNGQFAIGTNNVSTGVLELAYTLIGDTNLDGAVNLTDLLALLNNFGESGRDWSQGDLNYDGSVNLTDLLALLNNYGQSTAVAASNSAPQAIAPAAGGAQQSATPTFSWSAVPGATTYRLIVATNPDDLPINSSSTTGGPSVVLDVTTSGTSFTPTTPLSFGQMYDWEVIGISNHSAGTWSTPSSFQSAATYVNNTWIGAVGGDWDTAAMWSLGHVPTAAENAVINLGGSYTITHDQSIADAVHGLASSASINLSTGSIEVFGTAQLSSTFEIDGGSASVDLFAGTGKLTLGTTGSVGRLQLLAGGGESIVSSLIIQAGSTLDITSDSLLINFGSGPSPAATMRSSISSGYNKGAWNGSGIISSVAAANSADGVGYADGSVVKDTSAQPGQFLIEETLVGDTNLDGTVNLTDLLSLLNNYGQTGKTWAGGDSNYDGTVNLTDLLALLNNYGQSAGDTSIAVNSLASVVRPAATVTSYQAKSSPFTSAPLTLNSSGSLVGQTTNVLDIDANILQPDAGTIL